MSVTSARAKRVSAVADVEVVGPVAEALLWFRFHAPGAEAIPGILAAGGLVAVLAVTGAGSIPLAVVGVIGGLAIAVPAHRKELHRLRRGGDWRATTVLVRSKSTAGSYTRVILRPEAWEVDGDTPVDVSQARRPVAGFGRVSGKLRSVELEGLGRVPAWMP